MRGLLSYLIVFPISLFFLFQFTFAQSCLLADVYSDDESSRIEIHVLEGAFALSKLGNNERDVIFGNQVLSGILPYEMKFGRGYVKAKDVAILDNGVVLEGVTEVRYLGGMNGESVYRVTFGDIFSSEGNPYFQIRTADGEIFYENEYIFPIHDRDLIYGSILPNGAHVYESTIENTLDDFLLFRDVKNLRNFVYIRLNKDGTFGFEMLEIKEGQEIQRKIELNTGIQIGRDRYGFKIHDKIQEGGVIYTNGSSKVEIVVDSDGNSLLEISGSAGKEKFPTEYVRDISMSHSQSYKDFSIKVSYIEPGMELIDFRNIINGKEIPNISSGRFIIDKQGNYFHTTSDNGDGESAYFKNNVQITKEKWDIKMKYGLSIESKDGRHESIYSLPKDDSLLHSLYIDDEYVIEAPGFSSIHYNDSGSRFAIALNPYTSTGQQVYSIMDYNLILDGDLYALPQDADWFFVGEDFIVVEKNYSKNKLRIYKNFLLIGEFETDYSLYSELYGSGYRTGFGMVYGLPGSNSLVVRTMSEKGNQIYTLLLDCSGQGSMMSPSRLFLFSSGNVKDLHENNFYGREVEDIIRERGLESLKVKIQQAIAPISKDDALSIYDFLETKIISGNLSEVQLAFAKFIAIEVLYKYYFG